MPNLSPDLSALVASRHGIVTTRQMLEDGLSSNVIKRFLSAGALIWCHQGVYRVATSPDTFEARCAAVSAAEPQAVVTGPAAGQLWGFRHLFRVDQPIVLVGHGSHHFTGATIVRRTNLLESEDWLMRPDGIRVASPVRTWFDCARDVGDDRFERLTEWVLDRHASVPTLWRARRRLAVSGRRGSARVNRVLSKRATWQKPADSGLEVEVFRGLEERGIKGLVRQQAVKLPNGIAVHCDLALPHIRWGCEVDHVTWHGGRLDAQADKGRDRQLRRIGWQVDRVTDQELRTEAAATLDELVELIQLRRREVAA